MPAVGTVERSRPVSSTWQKYWKPVKKNSLSRFLLKFVNGQLYRTAEVDSGIVVLLLAGLAIRLKLFSQSLAVERRSAAR